MSMQFKQCAVVLGAKSPKNPRSFTVTLYDATELDRDGETIDLSTVRARQPITLQIDHDRSVLKTVGTVGGIRAEGQRLRGVMTFAPEGVSETADQMFRQVGAGVTTTVSIGFIGKHARAAQGHVCWTDVEVFELSLVSVPASPGARVDRKAMERWLATSGDDVAVEIDDEEAVLELADEDPAFRRDLGAQVRAATLAALRARGYGGGDPPIDPATRAHVEGLMRAAVREGLAVVVREAVESSIAKLRGRVD